MKLSWTKASGKISRYVIYRNGRKVASVNRKTLKYTDKNRKYGKTYSYKVRAYRKDVRLYGRWSAARKAVIRPGKVSSIEYTDASQDQITIKWKKAAGAAGYAVYRGSKLTARTKDTSYTDTDILPDKKYEYYIRSYVKNGKGSRKYVYGKPSKTLKVVTVNTSSDGRDQVDIYCAQTARDNYSDEDLEFLIDLIKNRLEPQAVEILLDKFPCMRAAADQGQIGKELGLYIYFKKGDLDGLPEHTIPRSGMMKIRDMAAVIDGNLKFAYMFTVDAGLLGMKDEDHNFIRDPVTGKVVIQREGESIESFTNHIAGEMLRALMLDYNRTGMVGATDIKDVYRNDDGNFPNEELAERYRKLVFPKWFTEGTAASVENIFRSENDLFEKLKDKENNSLLINYVNSENGFDLENNVISLSDDSDDPEGSCRVSGYLAVLYLSELSAVKTGNSSIDENGVVSAERLRAGLNQILERMHNGETLDQVINDISPYDSENKKLYSDTEGFEQKFIKGEKNEEGQYAGEKQSMDFINTLIAYLERKDDPSEKELSGGSILTDLKENYSPLDESMESDSDYMQFIDSNKMVESTVPNEVALAGGGRSNIS